MYAEQKYCNNSIKYIYLAFQQIFTWNSKMVGNCFVTYTWNKYSPVFSKWQWFHGYCAQLCIEQFRFEPWPGTLCCVLRQDTYLSQCCLSLGTGEFNVGDKSAMDKHPIQGEETGISYGIDGLLGLYAAFNLPLVKSSGCNIFISNQQIFNHGCDMWNVRVLTTNKVLSMLTPDFQRLPSFSVTEH